MFHRLALGVAALGVSVIAGFGCSKSSPVQEGATGVRRQAVASGVVVTATPSSPTLGGNVDVKVKSPPAPQVGEVQQTLELAFDRGQITEKDAPTLPVGWTATYYDGAQPLAQQPSTASEWATVTRVSATGTFLSGGALNGRQIYAGVGSLPLNAPVTASSFATNGIGDGWDVFFDDERKYLFNITHHGRPDGVNGWSTLMCRRASDGQPCSPTGWPFILRPTPSRSTGIYDAATQRVWHPTEDTTCTWNGTSYDCSSRFDGNDGVRVGWECVDVSGIHASPPQPPKPCDNGTDPQSGNSTNFVAVPDLGTCEGGWWCGGSENIIQVGRKVYSQAYRSSQLVCLDLDANGGKGGSCARTVADGNPSAFDPAFRPEAGFGAGRFSGQDMVNINDRLYTYSYVPAYGTRINCFDPATNSACSGWEDPNNPYAFPGKALPGSARAPIFGVPNADGDIDHVCVSGAPATCFTLDGTAAPSLWAPGFGTYTTSAPVNGKPAVAGTKLVYSSGWDLRCFDFATDAVCPNFGTPPGLWYPYSAVADPVNPYCVFTNGDNGVINYWDIPSATVGCKTFPPRPDGFKVRPTRVMPRLSCQASTKLEGWQEFKLLNPEPTEYVSATLTVRNSLGLPIQGWTNLPVPANQTFDLSALTAADTGDYPTFQLKFVQLLSDISGGAVGEDLIKIQLTAAGDPAELCAPMQLRSCPTGSGLFPTGTDTTTLTGSSVADLVSGGDNLNARPSTGVANLSFGNGSAIVSDPAGLVQNCGATLGGTLSSTDGDLLAGVTVALLDASGNPVMDGTTPVTATTDAQGVYDFPGMLPGDYQVKFVRVQLQPRGYWVVTSISEAGGATTTPPNGPFATADVTLVTGAKVVDAVYKIDSDGDGMTDSNEKGSSVTPVDTDGDGAPDYLDLDSDNDGIPDELEFGDPGNPRDTDGDGIPDFRDLDSDNDGIPDAVEAARNLVLLDGARVAGPYGADGLADSVETELDNGVLTYAIRDSDGDGVPDYIDIDSDNDGIVDAVEAGHGALLDPATGQVQGPYGLNGLADVLEVCVLAPTAVPQTHCGDDSAFLAYDPRDFDGDGVLDFQDLDSDNDGLPDAIEAGFNLPLDANGQIAGPYGANGFADAFELCPQSNCVGARGVLSSVCLRGVSAASGVSSQTCPDSGISGIELANVDGTGLPDYLDLDSDDDNVPDVIEAGHNRPYDANGHVLGNYGDNGLADVVEACTPSGAPSCVGSAAVNYLPVNTDGQPDYPDWRDVDSDDDGILDGVDGIGDSDGDGTLDFRETDSDNDGIPDSVEAGPDPLHPRDSDNDGIPDYRDIDSDNDGVLDSVENRGLATLIDTDNDNIPDVLDTDSDGDGLTDAFESGATTDWTLERFSGPYGENGLVDSLELSDTASTQVKYALVDWDGDGKADFQDVDSDDDNIPDSVEKRVGANGPADTDQDGIPDWHDLDSDNDGIPDIVEAGDADLETAPENTDGDTLPDYLDVDSDDDGVTDALEAGLPASALNPDGTVKGPFGDNGLADAVETTPGSGVTTYTLNDADENGTPDFLQEDSDADGIPDSVEKGPTGIPVDSDQDGIPDYQDPDSDDDGILDSLEGSATPVDTDKDGTPDYLDPDSDDDGIPDSVEMTSDPDGDQIGNWRDPDSDGDGLPDSLETAVDSDQDNTPDYLDLDSDDDGIPDHVESNGVGTAVNTDGDAFPDYLDLDSDNDGIADAFEKGPDPENPVDTDGDGIPDFRDLDSDNDGIADSVEASVQSLTDEPVDTDNDGIPDFQDLDADDDGLWDAVESGSGLPVNTDGRVDGPYGPNGFVDSLETAPESGVPSYSPRNTDGDALGDWRDLDSDGDGISDRIESDNVGALTDTDQDGIPDALDLDSDDDGILDSVELDADRDQDGTGNWRDLDSDGDGISDTVEAGDTVLLTPPVDTDKDGFPDFLDFDSDGDSLPDAVERGPKPGTLAHSDNDGTPNYLDLDSDNDCVNDADEPYWSTDPSLPAVNPSDSCGVNGTCNTATGTCETACATDADCGELRSARVCDAFSRRCADGCRGTDGNTCPLDSYCTSTTSAVGSCQRDSDFDGLTDEWETAHGMNPLDPDSDHDGIRDDEEVTEEDPRDTDGDGTIDSLDLDSDGDGIPDSVEAGDTDLGTRAIDTDEDGTPDYRDLDSDGDGYPDSEELAVDTDGDGTADYRDLDSDGDGVPDSAERLNGSKRTDGDSDEDGIPDRVETGTTDTAVDTDGDGTPDVLDEDSDNDGIPDALEKGPNGSQPVDTDGDGTPDFQDLDSDNDGIPDALEKGPNGNQPVDTDGDGTPDFRDLDSDGDGVTDTQEAGTDGSTPVDTDADGTPDFQDLDSDNDCVPDVGDPYGARVNAAVPSAAADANCPSSAPQCDVSVGRCVLPSNASDPKDVVLQGSGDRGCSSAGGGSLAALAWVLLALGRRRNRAVGAGPAVLTMAVAVSLAPGNASAQAGDAPGFALSRFEPSERGSRFFGLESLDWRADGQPVVGLVADYAYKPLVLYGRGPGGAPTTERFVVARHHLLGHLGAAVNVGERFRVGFDLPVVLHGSGEDAQVGLTRYRAPETSTLGDLRLGADWRFFGHADSGLRAGVGVRAFLPTGNPLAYAGDGNFRATAQLQVAGQSGKLLWAGRAGVAYRQLDTAFAEGSLGSEVQAGASVGYLLFEDKLLVGPELTAATRLGRDAFRAISSPVDLTVGGRYQLNPQWRLGAAVNRGFTSAFGEPTVRGIVSLEWTPAVGGACPPAAPVADRDQDGIADAQDACPDERGQVSCEARLNGCPPRDTDKDGIVDADDACWTDPGPASADKSRHGCPVRDADKDGIVDAEDACQFKSGPASADRLAHGCPVADLDQDGVPDAEDACVALAGVASPDMQFHGCPADLDSDSLLNPEDACPREAGPRSEDKKKSGCPVGAVVGGQLVLDQVKFDTDKDRIKPESDVTLTKVLEAIRALPASNRYRVEGHTDDRGNAKHNVDLSRRRAKAVVAWFVKRGLDAARFDFEGFGPTRPIATNETDEGRQANRRVEIHIQSGTNKLGNPP